MAKKDDANVMSFNLYLNLSKCTSLELFDHFKKDPGNFCCPEKGVENHIGLRRGGGGLLIFSVGDGSFLEQPINAKISNPTNNIYHA